MRSILSRFAVFAICLTAPVAGAEPGSKAAFDNSTQSVTESIERQAAKLKALSWDKAQPLVEALLESNTPVNQRIAGTVLSARGAEGQQVILDHIGSRAPLIHELLPYLNPTSPSQISQLVEEMAYPHPAWEYELEGRVAKMGHSVMREVLRAYVDQELPEAQAVHVFARCNGDGLDILRNALSKPQLAAGAIRMIGMAQRHNLLPHLERMYSNAPTSLKLEILEAIPYFPKRFVPVPLINSALKDPNAPIVNKALMVAHKRQIALHSDSLRELQGDDRYSQLSLIHALAVTRDPTLIPFFEKQYLSGNYEVKEAILEACATIGGEQALRLLFNGSMEPNATLQAKARKLLTQPRVAL